MARRKNAGKFCVRETKENLPNFKATILLASELIRSHRQIEEAPRVSVRCFKKNYL
jgi:hypothetical protein